MKKTIYNSEQPKKVYVTPGMEVVKVDSRQMICASILMFDDSEEEIDPYFAS